MAGCELRTGQLVVRRMRGILNADQVGVVIGRPDRETTWVMWTGGSSPSFDVHMTDMLLPVDHVRPKEPRCRCQQ